MKFILHILSHTITVRTVGKRYYRDADQIGESDYSLDEITLWKSLSPDAFAHTLLHEIIHIIDSAQYIKLKERQVQCLANGILSLLKDNPGFVENHILGRDLE